VPKTGGFLEWLWQGKIQQFWINGQLIIYEHLCRKSRGKMKNPKIEIQNPISFSCGLRANLEIRRREETE
jgi:hypothetical protein